MVRLVLYLNLQYTVPAQMAFVACDFLILMQFLRQSCINRKLEQMLYCPQHIIPQSEEILYQQRRMPCFQRPLFSIVHMIHIHPQVSSSGYHRISVFSFFPPSFLSFVGDSSSSANPRFLNSSLAIRFLRSILAIYVDARKDARGHTCPSDRLDMILPNSCTRDRSFPSSASYMQGISS